MNYIIRKIINRKQNGYGLIEIMLGLALTGMLATGLTAFTMQTMNVTSDTKDRMHALMQVENAGYWVSRDVQMSVNFTFGENAGFPLQLSLRDMDRNEYEVVYSLVDNGISRNMTKNGGNPVQTFIAEDINSGPSSTNISGSDGLFVFNVMATSGGIDVSRTYKIKPRLDLNS